MIFAKLQILLQSIKIFIAKCMNFCKLLHKGYLSCKKIFCRTFANSIAKLLKISSTFAKIFCKTFAILQISLQNFYNFLQICNCKLQYFAIIFAKISIRFFKSEYEIFSVLLRNFMTLFPTSAMINSTFTTTKYFSNFTRIFTFSRQP